MRILCRPATHVDLPDIVTLDHRCLGGLWNEATYGREIESPKSDLLVLVDQAQLPAQIVGMGCVWAILDEAHITLLCVDPDYQRRGLGRWLLIHLLLAASDRGLTHATLEVRPSNAVALSLYQALGFRIAGERRRYYADGENALILWRNDLQAQHFITDLQSQQQRLAQQWQIPV